MGETLGAVGAVRLLALLLVALSLLVILAGLGFLDVYHRTLSLYGGGWVSRPAVVEAAPVWIAGLAGIVVGIAYLVRR